MPNIATLLKSEIVRLSKKAAREYLNPVRSATAAHRRQLAALKRRTEDLERQVARLKRSAGSVERGAAAEAGSGKPVRFVAKGLVTLRRRLGLSAGEFGSLLDVSAQTIYNWETKKTTPRSAQVAAIAALRGIGKREAQARLTQKSS